MKRYLLFWIFVASFCAFWGVSCAPKVPERAEIVIVSFNDTHGDFSNLPQLAGFIDEMRDSHENVIVVNAGDFFTGNPYNDYFPENQYPIVDLLNDIGVDISTIGNHEFDYGVELLNKRIAESKSKFVSANIELETSGLQGIQPYHILKKNGVKIAFLGLTHVDPTTGKPAALLKNVEDIQFFDPIQTALKYAFLKDKSHIFIALTHIGYDEDTLLADAMPALNLIIGGHSHSLLEDSLYRNGVLITQVERGAKYVEKVTITLENGAVSGISNKVINLQNRNGRVDSAIVKKIRSYEEKNSFLKDPFATLKYEIPNIQQLGNLMADAPLILPNTDFSLMNCGGIRVENLPAGAINYETLLRVSPFKNTLVRVELTPAEIRKLIEMEFTDTRNCPAFPGGFEYVVKRMSDGTIRVEKLTFPNGKPLDETKKYVMILNNYIVTTYLKNYAESAEFTDIFVVDNLVEFLSANPNADYRNTPLRAKFN